MPYITKAAQLALLSDGVAKNPGDLNFVLTAICDEYLVHHGLKYQHLNDVVGALECCKLELYRRIAAPYEDIKLKENGDVYSEEVLSRGTDVRDTTV